ncbi:3-oxoacyl-[acyl-carrier-protein] synthase III [Yersinia massiliensis]|uniref:hypothetical protein n=1 Tax=Yersinia massiliensis TaxID=419257 RepID=UPI0005E19283|nr:3-oxoacyl-[acyl-carrier-protein] synthase III [Yersinia massiliensis]
MHDEVKTLATEAELSCPIVPINTGTCGGLTALELASALFHNTTMNYIAVITGCNYSHWFQESDPAQTLLSDGAACVVLGRKEGIGVEGCYTIISGVYIWIKTMNI